jgi:hypothetical protein
MSIKDHVVLHIRVLTKREEVEHSNCADEVPDDAIGMCLPGRC